MKASGNKIMAMFSAVVISLMLMVPVLSARLESNNEMMEVEVSEPTIKISEDRNIQFISLDFSADNNTSVRL